MTSAEVVISPYIQGVRGVMDTRHRRNVVVHTGTLPGVAKSIDVEVFEQW